jgi:superfamily II DNA or RNA helicase
MVPAAKFSPAFKNKVWDGKIRLFNTLRRTLYFGLTFAVEKFAKDRGYNVEYVEPNDFAKVEFSISEADQFVEKLKLPFKPREYQMEAFVHAVRNRRAILISPTGSGKSLIAYLLARLYARNKVLIIVPNIGLVNQLASDFINDYGCPPEMIHKIFSGQEKSTDAPFVITTWQSIYKLPEKWFEPYGAIIGDEVHGFKSKSLITIMENLNKCKYRFGLTGTLDGTQTNKLVLEGLFGAVKQVTTTSKLIEEKTLAQLSIKAIVLSYDDTTRHMFGKGKPNYKDELKYLMDNKDRNKFIVNLVNSLKNNTLLLFNNIAHGKILYQAIKEQNPDKDVFFVYGGVEGDEREEIRKYAENNNNVIIIASYKTFSTGINIKNIHNVIFGTPSKSRIRVFQSIGRGLRTKEGKLDAALYDIADDISWKSYKNHTIQHFNERIQMYVQEKFDYKIYTIKLKRDQ